MLMHMMVVVMMIILHTHHHYKHVDLYLREHIRTANFEVSIWFFISNYGLCGVHNKQELDPILSVCLSVSESSCQFVPLNRICRIYVVIG